MTHLIRAENEWRFDLFDEAFTIVARNRRTLAPFDVAVPAAERRAREALTCPFCSDDAPHPIDVVNGLDGPTVVALPSPTPLCFVEHGAPPERAFTTQGALGAHEILVATASALHGASLPDVDEETLAKLLWLFCRRRADLAGDKRLLGIALALPPPPLARLEHLHATLFAAPFPAPRFSSAETCPACRDLTDARAKGRVVLEGDGVVAYVPFAPRANVHVRVASLAHGTELLGAEHAEEHAHEVGRALHRVIAKVARVAPGAELLLRLCPLPLGEADDRKSGHLLLELEGLFGADDALGAGLGVRVVTVPPEDLADRLRAA